MDIVLNSAFCYFSICFADILLPVNCMILVLLNMSDMYKWVFFTRVSKLECHRVFECKCFTAANI